MPIVIPAPKAALRINIASQQNFRLVFLGTPHFAVPALRALHKAGWPVTAVITAPDKPSGRQAVLTPSPVKITAQELGFDVLTPATLKDEDFFTKFSNLRPDLCVIVAYGKLIPQKYLEVPRLGFLNIHPSLLPAYRGPAPIQGALLDGRDVTGVSLMQIDAELDHGPVLAQKEWTIPGIADYMFCEDELARLGAQLLVETLPAYVEGKVTPQPQNHDLATFTKKFERADGRLDWTQSAPEINNRIRALAHNPGTWTLWGDKTLNIFHSRVMFEVELRTFSSGQVFLHGNELAVACGQGALILEELQLESSTRQSAIAFLNGHPQIIGHQLV